VLIEFIQFVHRTLIFVYKPDQEKHRSVGSNAWNEFHDNPPPAGLLLNQIVQDLLDFADLSE